MFSFHGRGLSGRRDLQAAPCSNGVSWMRVRDLQHACNPVFNELACGYAGVQIGAF